MSILKVDELQSRTSGNRITLPDVNNYPPYRNLIINGDMSIAQRGTSVTGVNSGYQTIDRFSISTSSGSFDMAQSSNVPTGQGFATSLKLDCNTTGTFTSSQEAYLQQRIEAQNLNSLKFGSSNAENFTISFWVKSNKTGAYSVWLYSPDTTNNASLEYTINSANTWEKKVLNFVGDTSASIANDNGIGLEVRFYLATGPDIQGTPTATWSTDYTNRYPTGGVNILDNTANEWYITGVQLEVGDSATPFEHIPYDLSLARCQRYYVNNNAWKYYISAFGDGPSYYNGSFVKYPSTMRTSASITLNDQGGTTGQITVRITSGTSVTTSSIGIATNDVYGFSPYFFNASGTDNTEATAYSYLMGYRADAEL